MINNNNNNNNNNINNKNNKERSWTNGNITNTIFQGTVSRGGTFNKKGQLKVSAYSSSVLVPIEKKSVFSLTISSTETVHEKSKSYTVYVIRVKSDDNIWDIVRRYKHFKVFANHITQEIPMLGGFEFPSKKLIGNMNPQFIKHRRDQLQRFLNAIAESSLAKQSRNLKVFLDPNFSPTQKTIVNPVREGFLYLLKRGRYRGAKKPQWKRVYCIIFNSNLFYWRSGCDQPFAEADGVIQLHHCIVNLSEKEERNCIEINENNQDETNINTQHHHKYLFLKKKKQHYNNNNIANVNVDNSNNNSSNNENNEFSIDHDDLNYFASDTDQLLSSWLSTIEMETLKYKKDNNLIDSSSGVGIADIVSLNSPNSSSTVSSPLNSSSENSFNNNNNITTTTTATTTSNSINSTIDYNNNTTTTNEQQQQQQQQQTNLNNVEILDYYYNDDELPSSPLNINNNIRNNIRKRGIKLGTNKLNKNMDLKQSYDAVRNQYKDQELDVDINDLDEIDSDSFYLLESTLNNTIYQDLINIPNNHHNNNNINISSMKSKSNGFSTIPITLLTNNNNNTTTTTTTTGTSNNNGDSRISSPFNLSKTTNTVDQNQLTDKLIKDNNTALLLLEGEEIQYSTTNIIHVHQKAGTIGSITITNFRFHFCSYYGSTKMAKKCETESMSIPLSMISKIAKCTGFTLDKTKYYAFELHCKDFHKVRFMHLPGSSQQKANSRLFDILESYIFKSDYSKLFCFKYDELLHNTNSAGGWHIYNPLKEYERMNIPNEYWRITHFNNDYGPSPTYPATLVVPRRVSDYELLSVAAFRSKGRIPAVVWKSQKSAAVIVRCSQPVIGVTGKRSVEDEKLIDSVALSNIYSPKVYIMDARPQINAVANQMMGLGYEGTSKKDSYQNCILKFLNIENIHKMREAQKKIFKASMNENAEEFKLKYKSATELWLTHIKAILAGTWEIVDLIRFTKASVVVHCSDGWDRTSQLCALAELILDPHYRTLIGFQILIEKEWLSFGHKFESRIGQGSKGDKCEEHSPVFLQFIDCTWQIMSQNPTLFEFNEKYLLEILYHLYSCRFGTFLYDNESERVNANLSTRTMSLWTMFNELNNLQYYTNPKYMLCHDTTTIYMDTSSLTLWDNYYLQWKHFHGL